MQSLHTPGAVLFVLPPSQRGLVTPKSCDSVRLGPPPQVSGEDAAGRVYSTGLLMRAGLRKPVIHAGGSGLPVTESISPILPPPAPGVLAIQLPTPQCSPAGCWPEESLGFAGGESPATCARIYSSPSVIAGCSCSTQPHCLSLPSWGSPSRGQAVRLPLPSFLGGPSLAGKL